MLMSQTRYFREHKKNCKTEFTWTIQKQVQFSQKKYRNLEWTEGRGDNGKEFTYINWRKNYTNIDTRQDHMSVAQTLYTTTR